MLPGNEFNNIKLPDSKMVLTAELECVDVVNVTEDVHYVDHYVQLMFVKLEIISYCS